MVNKANNSNSLDVPSEQTIGQRIKGFLLGSGAGFKKLSEAFKKLHTKCSELKERIVLNWEKNCRRKKNYRLWGCCEHFTDIACNTGKYWTKCSGNWIRLYFSGYVVWG